MSCLNVSTFPFSKKCSVTIGRLRRRLRRAGHAGHGRRCRSNKLPAIGVRCRSMLCRYVRVSVGHAVELQKKTIVENCWTYWNSIQPGSPKPFPEHFSRTKFDELCLFLVSEEPDVSFYGEGDPLGHGSSGEGNLEKFHVLAWLQLLQHTGHRMDQRSHVISAMFILRRKTHLQILYGFIQVL